MNFALTISIRLLLVAGTLWDVDAKAAFPATVSRVVRRRDVTEADDSPAAALPLRFALALAPQIHGPLPHSIRPLLRVPTAATWQSEKFPLRLAFGLVVPRQRRGCHRHALRSQPLLEVR